MQFTLNKIFRLDDHPFDDEILQPLNKLFDTKKKKVQNFFKELIDV